MVESFEFGAQVPLGVGLGFKHKYKNDGHVSITIYGDGAQNQGQVFEVRLTSRKSSCCVVCTPSGLPVQCSFALVSQENGIPYSLTICICMCLHHHDTPWGSRGNPTK